MTLVIRSAAPAEWAAVADLHILSWRTAYRGILADVYLDGPVAPERRRVWQARFTAPADPDRIVVVAEEGGRLIGLACILAGYDPEWGSLIDNLHVDPDRKRGGIGRRILRAATKLVAPAHCATPIHLTVLDANAPAIAAYEAWGGRLSERLTKYEPDGHHHVIRRYGWDSPDALLACLDAREPG